MIKSIWDRVLGLAWILYGSVELSRALYYFVHIRVLVRGSDLRDFIGVTPFWVLLALLIVGGTGMALNRRWAWILTLVLALLYSIFSVFAVHGLANVWTFHRPPFGEVTVDLLPYVVFWLLTIWTVGRSLIRPRPWHSHVGGVAE